MMKATLLRIAMIAPALMLVGASGGSSGNYPPATPEEIRHNPLYVDDIEVADFTGYDKWVRIADPLKPRIEHTYFTFGKDVLNSPIGQAWLMMATSRLHDPCLGIDVAIDGPQTSQHDGHKNTPYVIVGLSFGRLSGDEACDKRQRGEDSHLALHDLPSDGR